MRRLIALASALLVAGCAEVPCDCKCLPGTQARIQAQRARIFGPQIASTLPPSKEVKVCTAEKPCDISVPVTVNPTDGSCSIDLAQLYCVVCMRKEEPSKGGKAADVKVIWRLTVDGKPTSDYRFTSKGITIYYAGETGKQDFVSRGHVRKPDGSIDLSAYTWTAGSDRSDRLGHGAVVVSADGTRECKPVDPDIVNTN